MPSLMCHDNLCRLSMLNHTMSCNATQWHPNEFIACLTLNYKKPNQTTLTPMLLANDYALFPTLHYNAQRTTSISHTSA